MGRTDLLGKSGGNCCKTKLRNLSHKKEQVSTLIFPPVSSSPSRLNSQTFASPPPPTNTRMLARAPESRTLVARRKNQQQNFILGNIYSPVEKKFCKRTLLPGACTIFSLLHITQWKSLQFFSSYWMPCYQECSGKLVGMKIEWMNFFIAVRPVELQK